MENISGIKCLYISNFFDKQGKKLNHTPTWEEKNINSGKYFVRCF